MPRPLVWWKCAFWLLLGGAVGAAVPPLLPEPGPGTAVRIDEVDLLTHVLKPSSGQPSNVTIYPPVKDVRLVTFTRSLPTKPGGSLQSTSAFLYERTPFVTAEKLSARLDTASTLQRRLQQYANIYARGGRIQGIDEDKVNAELASASAAVTTLNDALARLRAIPSRQWAKVEDVLALGQIPYTAPWWIVPANQYLLSILAGLVVIGTPGCLFLSRQSEKEAALAALAQVEVPPTASTASRAPTPEELARVAELDALLEQKLSQAQSSPSSDPATPAESTATQTASPKPVMTLSAGPLEPLAPEPVRDDKQYAGEFYPTERPGRPPNSASNPGFSLPELLVVIGILGLLLALLLPTLTRARLSADTLQCAANLRTIGQAMTLYIQSHNNTYPPSYLYIGHTINNGIQKPDYGNEGYEHWSWWLMQTQKLPDKVFTCPAMTNGGMPSANDPSLNQDPSIQTGVIDHQVKYLAFAMNEALVPRNKLVIGFQNAKRIYRTVKPTEVRDSFRTILATEMSNDMHIVSYGTSGNRWIGSHRPLHGYVGLDGNLDVFEIPPGTGIRQVTRADLDPDPNSANSTSTRLDVVGRNHGRKSGYPDRRLSNFLYLDNHVESKSVYDTLEPFEWGARFYSLLPSDDQR